MGTFPLLLLLAVVLAQALAVGYAAVLAGQAAEAGALALASGARPGAAARDALPGWSGRRARVRAEAGRVIVSLRPPALVPGTGRLLEVTARAAVAGPGP